MIPGTAVSVLIIVTALGVTRAAAAQTVIPVYPGSTLSVDPEDPTCCTFSTRDPLTSVVAFYQARLKTTALNLDQAAQKSPARAGQLRALAAQLPAGVQWRVFLLPDNQTFELLASPQRVTFSLTEEQLGEPGAAYAQDFAKRIAQAGGGEPGEAMEPTRQEYEQWLGARPLATAGEAEIPIYPGSRREARDDQAPGCYQLALITPDPMDQVVAFYAAKLGPGYVRNELEEGAGATFERTEFEVQGLDAEEEKTTPVVVIGPSNAVNRRVQIGTDEGMWLKVPRFDTDLRTAVIDRADATGITFTRQVPTQACVAPDRPKFIRRER